MHHITHPIAQALLTSEICENWPTVQKWLSRQTFSLDQIRVSSSYDRAIKNINFSAHNAKKGFIEATSDWIVRTDISRFYPTIYTHSIPWAAYGKEKVKADIPRYIGSLGDRLDLLVRKCNRDQTVGLPIGPETSRIIAEVISSRIDADFCEKERDVSANRDSIDRLQDDWLVGSQSLEESERLLSTISLVYRSYGLEINGSKTAIDRVVETASPQWISELGAFLSHKGGRFTSMRLREFLTLSLRLQVAHPTEPVTSYVLSVLESRLTNFSDVEALESFLLKSALTSPSALPGISRIFLNLRHGTKRISVGRIAKRFLELAESHAQKQHTFETVWLLYTLRGLHAPFTSKKILDAAEFANSSALSLILLDIRNKGLIYGKMPVKYWASQITEDRVLIDWTWLLGYEAIRLGWLPDPKGIMAKPFFRAMASRNVTFFDPTRNIASSTRITKKRRAARHADEVEVKALLLALRGLNNFAVY